MYDEEYKFRLTDETAELWHDLVIAFVRYKLFHRVPKSLVNDKMAFAVFWRNMIYDLYDASEGRPDGDIRFWELVRGAWAGLMSLLSDAGTDFRSMPPAQRAWLRRMVVEDVQATLGYLAR